jgi:hypothetical protein
VQSEDIDSGNNLLHTIVEEASLPYTSTPIVPRTEKNRVTSPESSHDFSDITPNNMVTCE